MTVVSVSSTGRNRTRVRGRRDMNSLLSMSLITPAGVHGVNAGVDNLDDKCPIFSG